MLMKALYLASLMSEVLKPYNKQTQEGNNWDVDKLNKNGEDVNKGGPNIRMFPEETLLALKAIIVSGVVPSSQPSR